MQLFADRFVSVDGDAATDLVTGRRVMLTVARAGAEEEERRWMARCEALQKLHHPAIARLVDFGSVAKGRRFEAWSCSGAWNGPGHLAAQTWSQAAAALRACGLSEGGYSAAAIVRASVGPVVVPDAESGYAAPAPTSGPAVPPLSPRSLIGQQRRATAALREMFDRSHGVRPRIATLWAPPGAGKATVVNELAGIARNRGFVPVSARLFPTVAEGLIGRSLFLIGRERCESGWRALVSATLATPIGHVLLFVGTEEVPGVDGVPLEPLTPEALLAAVRPTPRIAAEIARLQRVAERAEGWPGRFARFLWEQRGAPARAAEEPMTYQVDQTEARSGSVFPRFRPDDLVEHRQRLTTGVRLIKEGRHAPGQRVLRQAVGALARREDWGYAADGSLALAELLLRRGRPREAQSCLRDAADYWGRLDEPGRLVDVAVLSGAALTELARLEEAETVLGAAAASARCAGDANRSARAVVALARVLYWRGQYDEAERLLSPAGPLCRADSWSMLAGRLAVEVAVGCRAFDLAVSRSDEAVRCATSAGSVGLIADATCGAAFAHLAVGDLGAVERDVASCVKAARVVREPLLAAQARLCLAEALRRSGRHSAAAGIMSRIARITSGSLPPILRARCDLLREALSATGSIEEVVTRHVASTGLQALRLYLSEVPRARGKDGFEPVLDDIVDILDVCQAADDEPVILEEVCRRIRGRAHAAAVACLAPDGTNWTTLASDGQRIEPAIASRAMDARSAIAPHRRDDRIEAGAPIRYAGAIVGALVARWTIGTAYDLGHVCGLLTTAAAVVAPIVSAAVLKRRRDPAKRLSELIGLSSGIAEVRRAVERAAAAPFAVLIEGESGAGKELVARALHRCSPRRDRAFSTLNCAALPDDLVEAELFGHARGAFTGAVAERSGIFEDAHGGTLFLDEIGELSLRAQAKLLRVLQDGEVKRVGENAARRIDVRVIAATNRDLRQEIAAARFRLDLSYRLDVIRIVVPPLRERREDVGLLAEHFWREAAGRVGSRATLATATIAALARYDWPGNVRELQNVLASLAVRSPKRGVVTPAALGPQFAERRHLESSRLDEARRTFEEQFVRAALVRTGGRRTWAARELGVSRQGLTKLMARLGIALGGDAPDLTG